jgi:anti-repressor protein
VNIQVFENKEFQLHVTPDGDSFRVDAPGLAKALGFHSARDMVRSIPDPEKGWETAPTRGGDQRAWYVTEPGFYRALGQRQTARIKSAETRAQVGRFQDWVYGEVLPSIRRTGGYQTASATIEVTASDRLRDHLAEIAWKQANPGRMAGRVLASIRWNNPHQGIGAFGDFAVQLEFDLNALAVDGGSAREIERGDEANHG